MALLRTIGRWTLTGLMINCTIGGGIFGLSGELARSLGRLSPLAMLAGAVTAGIIIACAAEVASQFPEAGGSYLYIRRAFGRFAGLQAAWFNWLLVAGAVAAIANVCASYLGDMIPALSAGWARSCVTAVLIGIPTVVNCLGVRSGARLNSVLAVAKLLPMGLLIVTGLEHSWAHTTVDWNWDPPAADWGTWFTALLAVFFIYDGWEDVVVPSEEIKQPRKAIPFALGAGLLVAALIYALLQYVTISTVGTSPTDHALADVAAILMGDTGRKFVGVAAVVSSYGYIAAAFVTAPRLAYALANAGEGPQVFAVVHPTLQTPIYAIGTFAIVSWILAATGTFRWALELAAGSAAVISAGVCASLIQLRRARPTANALRVPFGYLLAILGIGQCAILLAQLDVRHACLLLVTSSLSAGNWLWVAVQRKYGRWRRVDVA